MNHQKLEKTRWNSKRLDEILTPNQIADVLQIYKANTTNEDALLHALRKYLAPLKQELSGKGVDDRFLGYVLFARLTGRLQ